MRPIVQTPLTAVALVAALAISPAFAQDNAAGGADAAPAQSGEPADQLGLSLGEPVDAEGNRLGEEYILDVEGDWTLVCIRTQLDQDPCSMRQLLQDADGNSISTVDVVSLTGGNQVIAAARIVTPLETLLTQQVTLSVDGGPGKRYPFEFCTEQGCIARVGFSDGDVNAFRRGNAATMTIVPALAPNQKVTATMSLSGFTAAFSRLQELNAANAAAVERARAAAEANGGGN